MLAAGFNAGDTDADNRLDSGETWRYTCAYTVAAHADGEADPLVNTATVSGKDFDGDAVTGDTDTASLDIVHTPGTLNVSKQLDTDQDGNFDEIGADDTDSTAARSPTNTP